MADGEPGTDTSAQGTCTFTLDELDIRESLRKSLAGWECSRPIWDETGSERCVWHAEHVNKPPDDLAATVDGDLIGIRARETDLTDANLWGADLTGATLRDATLTGATLRDATLTGATLRDATLTGADLRNATLTDADLRDADL
jgi:uncharacterized protein YjbI with pentapeptide repeats